MKSKTKITLFAISATLLCTFAGRATAQEPLYATKVAVVGEIAQWNDAVITDLNTPFTDVNGALAFIGTTTEPGGEPKVFVYHNYDFIFSADDALPEFTLTGGESTMGVGTYGMFVYSPTINGNDGIWSHEGYVISAGDPAPGLPGKFISFADRPTWFGDIKFGFIAGLSDTVGGPTTGRAVYKGDFSFSVPPTLQLLYKTGDVVAGQTLSFTSPGMSLNYDFSDYSDNLIHIVAIDSLPATSVVLLNDDYIARPGEHIPNGGFGQTYENFTGVGVNFHGRWIIYGDSYNINDFSSVGFLTFSNFSIIYGSDVLDNIYMGPSARCLVASVNNNSQVAHIWSYTTSQGPAKTLFVGEGQDLLQSRKIVSTGDQLDIDGDGDADYTVIDFTDSALLSGAMDLADDEYVATQLTVRAIGSSENVEGIFSFLHGPGCPVCIVDFNQDGGITGDDIEAFFVAFVAGNVCADADHDGGVTGIDVEYFYFCFELCDC